MLRPVPTLACRRLDSQPSGNGINHAMRATQKLHKLAQGIWFDNITRDRYCVIAPSLCRTICRPAGRVGRA